MGEGILAVFSWIGQCITLLDSVFFSIGGFLISLLDIIFVFICISMVISVFWKGARG